MGRVRISICSRVMFRVRVSIRVRITVRIRISIRILHVRHPHPHIRILPMTERRKISNRINSA